MRPSSRAFCCACLRSSTSVSRLRFFLLFFCSLSGFGMLVTSMFGRSLASIVQGVLGILMTMEAYFTVTRGERWFLKWYAPYMVLNSAVSIVIGALTLSGLDAVCGGAANPSTCTVVGLLYAGMMLLGGSSIGLLTAINATALLFAMREPTPGEDERKVAL
jgi:hypothetical protein